LRERISLFTPTIETVDDDEAFLTEDPLEVLKSGKINKVPIIAGVNSDEGLITSAGKF
jgi:carboxylesterase type B